MNKELFLKIRDHILSEPRTLNMSSYRQKAKVGDRINVTYEKGAERITCEPRYTKLTEKTAPPCGTVGCIAGWACMLSNEEEATGYRAQTLLDISREDASKLFYVEDWENEQLRKAYSKIRSPQKRAEIVAKVIDEFIAENSLTK